MDDIVDVSSNSRHERVSFIRRQSAIIDSLYNNRKPQSLLPEEDIIADLIENDKHDNSGLQSFIRNMFTVIEFDAHRKGRFITEKELHWYTNSVSKSVTDGILYFIDNDTAFPETNSRYAAAMGAHITHLLRDTMKDIEDGFINIPLEYLTKHNISAIHIHGSTIRNWVKYRVRLARKYFVHGKQYLSRLNTFRRKLAGYWYCARFEGVLDAIEKDDYSLRFEYDEHQKLSNWLNVARLGLRTSMQHLIKDKRRFTKEQDKSPRMTVYKSTRA
jgi:phytoene/squalene synthetase